MALLIRNFTRHRINANAVRKAMEAVLKEEESKKEVEVSLVFTGEGRIKKLNRTYRGVDRVTDVLSFEGENDDSFVNPRDNVSYLGEIFICYPRAERQAAGKGHGVQKEISILFIHGLFHLLGYDHIKDEDYKIMQKKEDKVLREIYSQSYV